MANSNKTSPKRIAARERSARALELRKRGYTFDQIASELGFAGRQGAFESVMSALRELTREGAEELRSLDAERLDELWRGAFAAALEGDAQALAGCLRIMERRAKLLGLDFAGQKEQEQAEPAKVMIVPYFADASAWEAAAVEQQARLKEDVKK